METERMTPEELREAQELLGLSDRQMVDRLRLSKPQVFRRYKAMPHQGMHRRIPDRVAQTVRRLVAEELEKL